MDIPQVVGGDVGSERLLVGQHTTACLRNAFCDRLRTAGMSTTVATPSADEECAYCRSRIFDHEPICVRDCTDDCGSPTYFCNYACLSAYVEENELVTGDACEWSPDDSDCC
jgi:hypothetical protein